MKTFLSRIAWYGVPLLASIAILWPLARPGFYVSDDGEWMVIRLSAFYQSLAEGQVPVRFLGRLNNSYGYPVANFLYPGFLYVGSLLHLVGVSFPDSVKVILAGSVIGSGFLMFITLRKHWSIIASSIGAMSFVTAPYLLFDLYKRGSVGEIFALVPATLGLYSIESDRKVLFPFAIALLIVAHNSIALITIVFFVIYILYRKSLPYIPSMLLGFGMAAFFWIPALVERGYVKFDLAAVSDPTQYFVTPEKILLIGLPFIVASLIVLMLWSRIKRPGLRFYATMFLVSLFFTLPTSFAFWQMQWAAKLIQFPYRFLELALLTAPFLVSATVDAFSKLRGQLILLYIVLGIFSLWPYMSVIEFVDRPIGYYTTNEATTTVADEYMPRWVRQAPSERISQKISLFGGKGTIVPGDISTQKIKAVITMSEKSIIQINTIYYPGWGVTVNDAPVGIDYRNENGLMRVAIPEGINRVSAEFRETPGRATADAISFGSGVAYIILIGRNTIWRRRYV